MAWTCPKCGKWFALEGYQYVHTDSKACEKLQQKKGGEMNERELIKKLVEALEELLSADSDMPSYQSTLDSADELVEEGKRYLDGGSK